MNKKYYLKPEMVIFSIQPTSMLALSGDEIANGGSASGSGQTDAGTKDSGDYDVWDE